MLPFPFKTPPRSLPPSLFLVSLFLALGLLGCDGAPHGVLQLELNEGRNQWAAMGASTYRMRQQLGCFCNPEITLPHDLEIEDGQILSAKNATCYSVVIYNTCFRTCCYQIDVPLSTKAIWNDLNGKRVINRMYISQKINNTCCHGPRQNCFEAFESFGKLSLLICRFYESDDRVMYIYIYVYIYIYIKIYIYKYIRLRLFPAR